MSRVIALLLIPLCLLGQPMPHAHADRSGKDDHDARTHIHVGHVHPGHCHHHSHGGGHHHHHDAEPGLPGLSDLPDHDADAVFLGDFRSGGSLRKVAVPQWNLDHAAVWTRMVPIIADRNACCRYVLEPPDPSGGTPLYLQATSLLI